jgi:hypothetical protein
MSTYGVAYGLLSGRIFVGRLNKTGRAFTNGKEDHTDQATWSAAEYIVNQHAGELELTSDGGVTMRIRAEVVTS